MSMLDAVSRPASPVPGEKYTITGMELKQINNKFKPGETKPLLILHTDKGPIYATSVMALEAEKDMADAEDTLIGKTIEAYNYFSTTLNRDLVGLKL